VEGEEGHGAELAHVGQGANQGVDGRPWR
jgi:hypothetical protein